MYFLTVDEVCALHARLIDLYRGSHGLREENLLRSALDRGTVLLAAASEIDEQAWTDWLESVVAAKP